MGARDPRVDSYIQKSPEFARPILVHLRDCVHSACPEVEETLKWRMPSFEYKGILCGMAAFKQHCTFGFWKHKLVVGTGDERWKEAMGSFGCIRTLADLPAKTEIKRMVRVARKLNDEGVKVARDKHAPKKVPAMHPALKAALAKSAKARRHFEGFSPSHRREYVEWIAEARTEPTRERRVAQAIEWLAEGRHRNWKYERRASGSTSRQRSSSASRSSSRPAARPASRPARPSASR